MGSNFLGRGLLKAAPPLDVGVRRVPAGSCDNRAGLAKLNLAPSRCDVVYHVMVVAHEEDLLEKHPGTRTVG